MSHLITYKIESDLDGKLKEAARISCNFWNNYLIPNSNFVIRLGTFFRPTSTIAAAWQPYENDGVRYGHVKFNTRFLKNYTVHEATGTIIHEIAHTLGIGWDAWSELFDINTGKFKPEHIKQLPDLGNMVVELEHGSGTRYSHWDEITHDPEFMTGFKDSNEHVLPVTIDVMELLGHQVHTRLEQKADLSSILNGLEGMVFSRQDIAEAIDRDYFIETELMEEIFERPLN